MDTQDFKNKLKIEVFNDKNEDRIKKKREGLEPILIKPHFTVHVSASMEKGKSTILCNLIKFYREFFDQVIYFSPTANVDEKIKKCLKKQDFKFVHSQKMLENVLDMIEERREEKSAPKKLTMKELILGKKKPTEKPIKDTLLILDDASAVRHIFDKSTKFSQFLYSHRHYNTSIFFVTHYYKQAPLCFRSVVKGLIIFEMGNAKEIDMIIEENNLSVEKDVLKDIIKFATKEPFSFLVIDKSKSLEEGKFTKKFDMKLIPK